VNTSPYSGKFVELVTREKELSKRMCYAALATCNRNNLAYLAYYGVLCNLISYGNGVKERPIITNGKMIFVSPRESVLVYN
jgi:hypothetical protein